MYSPELQIKLKKISLRIAVLYELLPSGKFHLIHHERFSPPGFSDTVNYEETGKTQSVDALKSKLAFAYQEAVHFLFSLEPLMNLKLMPPAKLWAILKEANELTRKISSSQVCVDRKEKHK